MQSRKITWLVSYVIWPIKTIIWSVVSSCVDVAATNYSYWMLLINAKILIWREASIFPLLITVEYDNAKYKPRSEAGLRGELK